MTAVPHLRRAIERLLDPTPEALEGCQKDFEAAIAAIGELPAGERAPLRPLVLLASRLLHQAADLRLGGEAAPYDPSGAWSYQLPVHRISVEG